MRISCSASPFPAQLLGPKENGKNAAGLWTIFALRASPEPARIHRSGQKLSGKGEKLRGSRWMLYMCTVVIVPSGM